MNYNFIDAIFDRSLILFFSADVINERPFINILSVYTLYDSKGTKDINVYLKCLCNVNKVS